MPTTPTPRDAHRWGQSLTRVLRAALVSGVVLCAPPPLGATEAVRRVSLMGTWLEVRAEADDRAVAVGAAERAVAAVEAAEARLSTWRRGTELDLLNRAPAGAWLPLSPLLLRDLEQARRWAQGTDGAFSPTVGPLVAAWGLRSGGRVPSARELERALAASRLTGLELARGRARRVHADLAVEEGGFGKGAALADALAAVAPFDACVVLDLGGQVAIGPRCDDRDIDLAHPIVRDRVVASVRVGPGSVATSGNSVQRLAPGGGSFGHLLDPRSGRPAPVPGSATVLASDPIAADCLATALAVMGDAAPAWLVGHPEVDAVLARPDGEGVLLLVTPGTADRIVGTGPGVEIDAITGGTTGSWEGKEP